MNQPDLGLKITELRQQKGLTQEKLAEYCDVSARTIQRIESGEVEPRSFTRNTLSNILEFDLGRENTEYEWIWLALLHFSSIVCFIPLSLAIWSARKSESHKVDQQGRAVLNFQITVILMLFSLALGLMVIPAFLMMLRLPQDASGTLFGISPVLILLISLFTTYQGSVNLYRAFTEKQIHYPLSIPFVK